MTYDPFGAPAASGYDPLKDARFGWSGGSGQAVTTAVPAPVTPVPQAVPSPPPLAPAALVGVSVVLAVLAGAFGFAALDGVRLTAVAETIDRGRGFLIAAVVAVVLDLVAVVWQVVLLARVQSVASVVGIVLGLLLPVGTVWYGLATGTDAMVAHLSAEVSSGVDLPQALSEAVAVAGVERDWVVVLILALLEMVL